MPRTLLKTGLNDLDKVLFYESQMPPTLLKAGLFNVSVEGALTELTKLNKFFREPRTLFRAG